MKDIFIIEGLAGKRKLNGVIPVRGAKNAALPVMASAILFSDALRLVNVPHIDDVVRMGELLEDLGGETELTGRNSWLINAKDIKKTGLNDQISKRMRASIVLSGPLLARYGKVSFPHPGGCVIGERPIDMFLEGFKKMGAAAEEVGEEYRLSTGGKKLRGAEIFFKIQSVTNTETFIMAGVLAQGTTVLKNAAMEPEVKSLAEFLVSCGASIKGAGTPTIEITGGKLLSARGKGYATIPDRIEAGSFLILGALAAEHLEITDCNPADLESVIDTLRKCGVSIKVGKRTLIIDGKNPLKNSDFRGTDIKTHEYPGFPTDLQAPMAVFLTQVSGESGIFETIFENRLNYTADLVKMGANITTWNPNRVSVKGPTPLSGRELDGPDIRAGLAYVLAAIVAHGRSVINNVHYIDRGYERIEERLRAVGVDIERVTN